MRSFSFSLCALGTAAALLCPAPAHADVAGLVRGTVSIGGKPAAGAQIELSGSISMRAAGDAEGHFSFPHVPFGRYTLRAVLPGYQTAQTSLDVSSDAIVTANITLFGMRELARTNASASAGVSGTPVAVNVIDQRAIDVLPAQNSLGSIIQTVPGIVPFSYNEPIAHGFHGITYEIDGAPLPQSTSSNFAEIVDPRQIDSMEIFTGAIPAEFGGNRMGAVVNLLTQRPPLSGAPSAGTVSLAAGSYGTKEGTIAQSLKLGSSRLFLSGDLQRSDRGLDSPTFVPEHDAANQVNEFVRFVTPIGERGTLAADISNQNATFQIPINTSFNPNDPVLNAPGTDDTQIEQKRFANIVFTENTPDRRGYYQIVPWFSYDRIAYRGDLARDVLGSFSDDSGTLCAPAQEPNCPLDGLREDRHSNYGGLRLSYFHSNDRHALKFGVEGNYENFAGKTSIAQVGQPNFTDNIAMRGTQFAAYAQDKWSVSKAIALNLGVRYDRSSGFISGNQLSPRLEINVAPDRRNIVHFYYGRFYAAPFLEDTRCDAVVSSGGAADCGTANLPAYDLQPERDTYYEGGIAHTFNPELKGYVNYWARNVSNALDTTQIFPTPIFAVYNNTIGQAEGVEMRLEGRFRNGDSMFFSGTAARSLACGISGGTFLFTPDQLGCFPAGLQPEDHDQTYTIDTAYTHRFGGPQKRAFATLQPLYGSGYPVEFQNGDGRLTPHLTFNASLGVDPGMRGDRSLGYRLDIENLTGHAYLLKIDNGFNTTQWAPGFKALFRVTAPI